jgi:Protein of unknown function (DUF3302)
MQRSRSPNRATLAALALTFGLPSHAHAAILHGEALDSLANGIAWVAIIIGPIIGIAIFWMVHILPEKIAEKKKHPQTKGIQCLCLLSLAFGGLLWPLAWMWAYTKPVLHKMAYGTDVDEEAGHHGKDKIGPAEAGTPGVGKVESEARIKQKGGKA